MSINVLFVCFGNICRSPTAQGILEQKITQAGLEGCITVDSCGTAAINAGRNPDPRAVAAARLAGYAIGHYIARQIADEDYRTFDYIVAMDHQNLRNVKTWAPDDYQGEIELLMNYCDHQGNTQVPDPYHDAPEKFIDVLTTLEKAVDGLLETIRARHLHGLGN